MTTETPDVPPSTAPAPQPAPPPSPGAMIREARERARFSLEDMVAHTKLARGTLEALERDDYNALLEAVYVRGYYRKCAKVLEMDEERLIAAYLARVSPKAPEAPSKLRLASGTELGSTSRLPVSMAVLIAVVAIVVCAVIWFARDAEQGYPLIPVPAESVAPVEQPLTVPVEELMVEPQPAEEETGESGETAPADGEAMAPAAAGDAAAAAPMLRLRFNQTSWVRIDDAAGKTLVNEMRSAGAEESYSGALPLSVFLGNAPGVVAEFDGRPLDLSGQVRSNNTARFTVPAQ